MFLVGVLAQSHRLTLILKRKKQSRFIYIYSTFFYCGRERCHDSCRRRCRLNEPKMSEAERQLAEGERADRSLFVQELLLSTLMRDESSSSDEDERRDFADFGAMGCVDIMPLDVALEHLQLRERASSSSAAKEPPPPPL